MMEDLTAVVGGHVTQWGAEDGYIAFEKERFSELLPFVVSSEDQI